jgi:hypothetical protein
MSSKLSLARCLFTLSYKHDCEILNFRNFKSFQILNQTKLNWINKKIYCFLAFWLSLEHSSAFDFLVHPIPLGPVLIFSRGPSLQLGPTLCSPFSWSAVLFPFFFFPFISSLLPPWDTLAAATCRCSLGFASQAATCVTVFPWHSLEFSQLSSPLLPRHRLFVLPSRAFPLLFELANEVTAWPPPRWLHRRHPESTR